MPAKKNSPFNFALFAQIIFWVVLFIFVLSSSINMGLTGGLIAAFLLLSCHLANFYIVYGLLTPLCFEKKAYGSFLIGVVVLLLLLTPFRLWVEDRFIHRPFLALRGRRIGGLVLFSELSIVGFAFLFRMAQDNYTSRRRADEMENLQLETELKFLKSQMNPHFLFNTINNVYALSLTGSDKTPAALLKLSDLLRYLLYECNQKVPVFKELQAMESYIALFQLRYEDPLNIRLDAGDVRSMNRVIEPMLLIPLLENAVKHSSIGVLPGAFIGIRLGEEAGQLTGRIINSRSGNTPVDQDAGGIGLQNIRKRLDMVEPGLAAKNLHILETPDLFEVFIKIPGA